MLTGSQNWVLCFDVAILCNVEVVLKMYALFIEM